MMLDLLDIFSDQASIVLPTFKSDIWVLLKIAAECLQNVHDDIDLVFSDNEYLLKDSINGMSLFLMRLLIRITIHIRKTTAKLTNH